MSNKFNVILLAVIMFCVMGAAKCINSNGKTDYITITKGTLYTSKTTIEAAEKAFAEYYETTSEILLDEVGNGTLTAEEYAAKKQELLTTPKEQVVPLLEKARSIHNSAVIILFELEPLVELAQANDDAAKALTAKKLELNNLLNSLQSVITEIIIILTTLGVGI